MIRWNILIKRSVISQWRLRTHRNDTEKILLRRYDDFIFIYMELALQCIYRVLAPTDHFLGGPRGPGAHRGDRGVNNNSAGIRWKVKTSDPKGMAREVCNAHCAFISLIFIWESRIFATICPPSESTSLKSETCLLKSTFQEAKLLLHKIIRTSFLLTVCNRTKVMCA